MTDALTSLDMSTGLRKVAERAKREPAARFHSLAHLIDEELLAGAFARLRGDAALGVDGITKEQYGQDLQNKLRDLHERLKTKRYRHQPIRRVHIPKEKKGQTRPIGISATEDKVVGAADKAAILLVKVEATWQCRTFKWVGSPPGKLLTTGPVSSLAGVVVTSRLMRRHESKRGGIAANAAVKVG
jgi:hypothetical protein